MDIWTWGQQQVLGANLLSANDLQHGWFGLFVSVVNTTCSKYKLIKACETLLAIISCNDTWN